LRAEIYFGSKKVIREDRREIISPYSGEVVSSFPICSAEDSREALRIAEESRKEIGKVSLSKRCDWLLDVAKSLEESRDEVAKNYY
jgi:acyl-CoA reductase-like NAD-dependent aldehyde dehydrogenase